jgi:hypothetical protein
MSTPLESLIEKVGFTTEILVDGEEKSTSDTTLQIEQLLSLPLTSLSLRVMELPAFAKLMTYLPWGNWRYNYF